MDPGVGVEHPPEETCSRAVAAADDDRPCCARGFAVQAACFHDRIMKPRDSCRALVR
jgi:hypothetical protein